HPSSGAPSEFRCTVEPTRCGGTMFRPKPPVTVFVKLRVVTLPSAATVFSGLVRPPPTAWARWRLRESSMAKLTDRELVDRAREGDAQAFGQLVRRHQQRIHR